MDPRFHPPQRGASVVKKCQREATRCWIARFRGFVLMAALALPLDASAEREKVASGVFKVDQSTEATGEVVRLQRLFQTPTSVGNGPGMFIYTPISSFRGNVYYTWFDDERRPQIVQIRPDGSRTVASVEQPDYQAFNDGHHRLSLGVDAKGFIHIAGDMHGGVNDTRLSTDRFKGATTHYWRSKRPGDITEFEFLGKDPSRNIPIPAATYAFFLRDRNGVLYFAGRTVASPDRKNFPDSHRGVGLYRYDSEKERWTALGGILNPVNGVKLEKTLFNSVNQWGWYRWNMVGMCFDQHNRLHFAVNTNTPLGEGTHAFYAASDDGGETWQRADGSRVELPMIDNLTPHPNRPDMIFEPGGDNLATSGPTYPFFNSQGVPGVSVSMKMKTAGPSRIKYIYWNTKKWSAPVDSPIPNSFSWTKNFYLGRDGLINFVDHDQLFRAPDFEKPGQTHKVPGEFAFIDPISLLEENSLLAVLGIGAERTAVCRLDFLKNPEGGWRTGYEDLKGSPLDEKVALLEAGRTAGIKVEKRFRPEDQITAGEWVNLLLEARRWKAVTDSTAHWNQALGEEILKKGEIASPKSTVSRALLLSMLVRSAPGEAWPEVSERWQQTVPAEGLDPEIHRALASATALGLVPLNWLTQPANLTAPATRGEAVEVLYRLYFPGGREMVVPKPAAALIAKSQVGTATVPSGEPVKLSQLRASHHLFRAGPDKLVDGDPKTVFRIIGDQYLEIRLDEEAEITGFRFVLPGTKTSGLHFKAYTAGEDRNWKLVAESSNTEPPAGTVCFSSQPHRSRYLRLDLFTDKGKVTEIAEMTVFQKK